MSAQLQAVPATFKIAQPTRHIDAIKPHPDNPRDEIRADDPKVIDLAKSIIQFGVIEPLVINSENLLYAGHRRRIAARVAAQLTGDAKYLVVPVIVSDQPADSALELMLQENMQRESLNPLEEARAMHAIREAKKLTTADLIRYLELPPEAVSQRLSILRCETDVQELYRDNEIPLSAAPFLARVCNAEKQIRWAGLLARRQITLAAFKKQVQGDLNPVKMGKSDSNSGRSKPVPVDLDDQPINTANSPRGTTVAGQHHAPTRAEAVAGLNKKLSAKISLHTISVCLEQVCCACGVKGDEPVCRTCPLPRLISAVTGRAEVSAWQS